MLSAVQTTNSVQIRQAVYSNLAPVVVNQVLPPFTLPLAVSNPNILVVRVPIPNPLFLTALAQQVYLNWMMIPAGAQIYGITFDTEFNFN